MSKSKLTDVKSNENYESGFPACGNCIDGKLVPCQRTIPGTNAEGLPNGNIMVNKYWKCSHCYKEII